MTPEIITALKSELFWTRQLKTLIDQALITVTDPFTKDEMIAIYQAAHIRGSWLHDELALFQATP